MRLLLALLWCLLPSVMGETFSIDWFNPNDPDRVELLDAPLTVSVDDTIEFTWDNFFEHNVYIYNSKTCASSLKTQVSHFSKPTTYKVIEVDVFKGDIFFACDVGKHCELGMRTTVTVLPYTWFVPETGTLPSRNVLVGQTINFVWDEDKNHNVYRHLIEKCNTNSAVSVGETSGAHYTFGTGDLGNIFFSSRQDDDCTDGMTKKVTVSQPWCFSGDDRVQVENKGLVEIMAALEIGDNVLVSGNKYEAVYSFGHRNLGASAEYLEIHSDGTNDPLKISPDHMILSGGEHWVPAAALRVGDTLNKGNGSVVVVTKIQDVMRKGIFAPFTASGSIVVNDIVASDFIAFQGSEYLKIGEFATPFTFQWLSHSFESGHHLACSSGFVDCDQETYTDSGVSHWADTPHQVARWWLQQHAAVTLVLLVPLVLVFGFLAVLEHPVWLCTFLAAVMLARSFRAKNGKMTA